MLYVAATRARRSLHLLGSVKVKDTGAIAEPDSRSFLKLLWPILSEQFANPHGSETREDATHAGTIRRLPPTWHIPSAPPPVEWERPRIERAQKTEVAFDWASDRARYAGAALHAFLQRIAREGLEGWNEAAVRSRSGAYRAVLTNLGVSPGDLAWAAERVESGLLHTLRDQRGRWILENHADPASELSIAGIIDGSLCEVVLDRTFVDEAGVRWIIDYKTGTHEGADVENFLAQQKDRYREQLERYARLMMQRDANYVGRPIRLGLYFPLLGEWLEWAAPTVLRKQAMLFEI